ncbi:hypothetical protein B5F25_20370 [Bacteroides sp. An19]|nr:hypothetical protein B5F25_20370 [Bacteroides sp. An19]
MQKTAIPNKKYSSFFSSRLKLTNFYRCVTDFSITCDISVKIAIHLCEPPFLLLNVARLYYMQRKKKIKQG